MLNSNEQYLRDGEQTTVSKKTLKEAPAVDFTNNLEAIFALLNFIHQRLKLNERDKEKFFRRRTAQEILESGFATGCTDYALSLLPLLRHNGIPARYVETARNRWLEHGSQDLEGHVFIEVFLNDNWYIIDPQERTISNRYTRHQVIDKGLDSWDIGIRDLESLKKRFLELKLIKKSFFKRSIPHHPLKNITRFK